MKNKNNLKKDINFQDAEEFINIEEEFNKRVKLLNCHIILDNKAEYMSCKIEGYEKNIDHINHGNEERGKSLSLKK